MNTEVSYSLTSHFISRLNLVSAYSNRSNVTSVVGTMRFINIIIIKVDKYEKSKVQLIIAYQYVPWLKIQDFFLYLSSYL